MGILAFEKFFLWRSTAQREAKEQLARFQKEMRVSDELLPLDLEEGITQVLYESKKIEDAYKNEN